MSVESQLGFSPARRLFEIVEQLAPTDQRNLLNCWLGVLTSDSERATLDAARSHALFFRRLGLVAELSDEAAQALMDAGAEGELYVEAWRKPITLLLDTARWHTTSSGDVPQLLQLVAKAKDGLRYAAHELERGPHEKRISQEQVSELLEQLEAAVESLRGSDLPEHAKAMLVRRLLTVHDALVEYRITGADGIWRATESAVAEVYLHRDAILSTPQGKPLWKETLGALWKAAKAAATAHEAYELGEKMVRLLQAAVEGGAG